MRFIKTLALIFFFFLSMLFFVQNTETLTSQIVIKLEIFQWNLVSPATPLYLLILFSFVLGSILTLIFFFAERIRLASLARNNKKQANKVDKELKKTQEELENLKKVKAEEETAKAEAAAEEVQKTQEAAMQAEAEQEKEKFEPPVDGEELAETAKK